MFVPLVKLGTRIITSGRVMKKPHPRAPPKHPTTHPVVEAASGHGSSLLCASSSLLEEPAHGTSSSTSHLKTMTITRQPSDPYLENGQSWKFDNYQFLILIFITFSNLYIE